MKVADLMDDLEKGDRTMEHLTAKTPGGALPPGMAFVTSSDQMDALRIWSQWEQQSQQLGNYMGALQGGTAMGGLSSNAWGGSPWNR